MMVKLKRIKFSKSKMVPLMNVGAVAIPGVNDGKLLPYLVIDTSNTPKISQYFDVHREINGGDAGTQWGSTDTGDMFLLFDVTHPSKVEFGILFDMQEHAFSVDQIMRTKAIHLQQSNPLLGKRVNLDAQPILIGIGAEYPEKVWEDKLYKFTRKKFQKSGVPRHKSKDAAKSYIKEIRKLGSLRQKGHS